MKADNRLYKEAPAVTPKPKPKSRVKSSSSRSRRKTTRNSRRRGTNTEDGEDEDEDEDMTDANGGGRKGDDAKADEGEEGAGRWRLICRTEDEWESFPAQFARSRDSDESVGGPTRAGQGAAQVGGYCESEKELADPDQGIREAGEGEDGRGAEAGGRGGSAEEKGGGAKEEGRK
ncbi:hypothetical protein BC936DRAFT_141637, partial [Jimgerdemannia flammicorona]